MVERAARAQTGHAHDLPRHSQHRASTAASLQHVSVLTLQFAEIIDLLSYYDRMRRLHKQLQDPFRAGRPSLESVGSFHSS